jgi:hypothetical protein
MIKSASASPCTASQVHDASAPDGGICLTLAGAIIHNADVLRADVAYDTAQPGWLVQTTLTPSALHRLANVVVAAATSGGSRDVAVLLDDRVLTTFTVNPGVSGNALDIEPGTLTRATAIALATSITGKRPRVLNSQSG